MEGHKRYRSLFSARTGLQLVVLLFAILFISPSRAQDAYDSHREQLRSVCNNAGTSDMGGLNALEGKVAQADASLSQFREMETKRNVAKIKMEVSEGRDQNAYNAAKIEYDTADAFVQKNSDRAGKLTWLMGQARDCISTRRAKIEAEREASDKEIDAILNTKDSGRADPLGGKDLEDFDKAIDSFGAGLPKRTQPGKGQDQAVTSQSPDYRGSSAAPVDRKPQEPMAVPSPGPLQGETPGPIVTPSGVEEPDQQAPHKVGKHDPKDSGCCSGSHGGKQGGDNHHGKQGQKSAKPHKQGKHSAPGWENHPH